MRLPRPVRRRLEVLLDSVVPGVASVDTATFWTHLERDGAPHLIPGLLAMAAAIDAWAWWRTGSRLSALPPPEREAFLSSLELHPSSAGRSLLGTLKILACFARFDDPATRRAAGAP